MLRASLADGSEPAGVKEQDAVARRLELFAALLRSAPATPLDSWGRLLLRMPRGGVRVIPLRPGRVEIGRADGCDLRLDDPEVSRRHCRLEVDTAGTWLSDLEARNGTWLNERRVSGRVALRDGTVIRLGATWLAYARP